MGQTRGQLKLTIRTNLDDAGVTFYSETDLDDSFQDCYEDITCLSQCIVKSVTLSWVADLSYLNFVSDYGLIDYLAATAIFNYNTNRWLRDDLNLRDFDKLRTDWELWSGTPQFWATCDPLHIAIAPKYSTDVSGTFKLVYWALAPVLSSDSDTLLVSSDVQSLFEFYVTADLLEQAQEYSKASEFWQKYYTSLEEYSNRVKRINKSDLLLRI